MRKLTCTGSSVQGGFPGVKPPLRLLVGDSAEVGAIARFAEPRDIRFEARAIDPVFPPGNFFDAGDLQTLAVFDYVYKLRRFEHWNVRACVEPRSGTAKEL